MFSITAGVRRTDSRCNSIRRTKGAGQAAGVARHCPGTAEWQGPVWDLRAHRTYFVRVSQAVQQTVNSEVVLGGGERRGRWEVRHPRASPPPAGDSHPPLQKNTIRRAEQLDAGLWKPNVQRWLNLNGYPLDYGVTWYWLAKYDWMTWIITDGIMWSSSYTFHSVTGDWYQFTRSHWRRSTDHNWNFLYMVTSSRDVGPWSWCQMTSL